jgi:SAM-dependent methyltransferase
MQCRIDRDGGGPEEGVSYTRLQRRLPAFLRRYILHFETAIDDSVARFAAGLEAGARVLDAGAGEGKFAGAFERQRYTGLDLGIGDTDWNYSGLDALGDLERLPFPDDCFDGCINIVTLEHVREPAAVVQELYRTLKPGGSILLVTPHEWEEHQQPHDYFRFTRFGMEYLLQKAGFTDLVIQPVGGYFRLLSRRLMNGLQFFPGLWAIPAALLLGPPALLLPLLDPLDRHRSFTLGYVCTARKR